MEIHFIDHAVEEFVEHDIPTKKIRQMLGKGIIIDDTNSKFNRRICIYKEGNRYYSVVFQTQGPHIFIVTGYPSKKWEAKMYKERRK